MIGLCNRCGCSHELNTSALQCGTFTTLYGDSHTPNEALRIAQLEAELTALRADLARISEEYGLPPTIGPAPGEIKRREQLLRNYQKQVEALREDLDDMARQRDQWKEFAYKHPEITPPAVTQELVALRARLATAEADVARLRKAQDEALSRSLIANCLLIPKEPMEDTAMFYGCGTGPEQYLVAHLDGYAIVPRERYEQLLKAVGGVAALEASDA